MATSEEINYMQQMEAELQHARNDNKQLAQGQMSIFAEEQQDNLIRWQLDLKEDLDRLYHLLKGDKIGEDDDGNICYLKVEDDNSKPFNEFGVQLLMNVMSFYLNRNTILSNYKEEVINWKILDFGNEVSDLIFNRYEEMMTTINRNQNESKLAFEERVKDHLKNKLKLYPMIVRELVDTVHSAYLRAFHGGERDSLRTARTVTQSEPIGFGNQRMTQPSFSPQQKNKHWYNPGTWGR